MRRSGTRLLTFPARAAARRCSFLPVSVPPSYDCRSGSALESGFLPCLLSTYYVRCQLTYLPVRPRPSSAVNRSIFTYFGNETGL